MCEGHAHAHTVLLLFQVSDARLLGILLLLGLAQALLAGIQLLCQSLRKQMTVKCPDTAIPAEEPAVALSTTKACVTASSRSSLLGMCEPLQASIVPKALQTHKRLGVLAKHMQTAEQK